MVGAPKGLAPKCRGPEGGRGQNFTNFSLSRHYFHSFFLSWRSFCGIGGVSESRDLKCARLEFLGCRVKPRPKSARVSHDSPCTFQGPGLQRHKRAKWRAGEGESESGGAPKFWTIPTKILNTHTTHHGPNKT